MKQKCHIIDIRSRQWVYLKQVSLEYVLRTLSSEGRAYITKNISRMHKSRKCSLKK